MEVLAVSKEELSGSLVTHCEEGTLVTPLSGVNAENLDGRKLKRPLATKMTVIGIEGDLKSVRWQMMVRA